jgi:hypothetical protein
MAIGRISGSVLKSNLTRNGVDLAFETNLLYLDVTNSRVGIGTSEPTTALQVNGTATTTGLNTTNLSIGGTAVTSTATELNVLDGTTLGAANELCVVDATGNFITTSSTLSIDQGNNYIGINQSSPEVTLHMTGEGAQTSQIRMEQYNDSADAPDVRTRRYRGTIASPSAVASGDYLFRSNHEYWNGSALIVGGTFAFDNTNNANRTQFAVSVTTDGTSADANTPSKTQFKIDGNDSGAITFNNAYKFPTSDGTANQVLATDGSGTVSFMDIDAVTSITFVGDDSTGTAVNTNETFKIAGTQNITTAVSGDTLTVTGPDLTSYITASSTDTLTNKTFDANGTGNSITNIDSGNFLSGFFKDEDDLSSDSATSVASQQSIKAYVDAEVGAVSTSSISQGNSNVTVTDSGVGTIGITTDGTNIVNFSTALAIDASNSNTAFRLPGGTTGQRPAGAVGMIRYNSSTDKIEGYTTAGGWAEFGAGASSSEESGDSVIGIGPNPKNIATFTTGTYDSAFFYAILRDESNDEVSTARYSLVHNDTGAFVATSHVNESDTANDYMTVDADITDGVVRLRGTGVSNINSVSYYEIPLGDNTEAGTTGNVTKFINTDVDSASEVIDSFALSSIRGAKYFISTKDDASGEVSNTEAIVVHDGSTAYITQYGTVNATDNNRDLLTLTVEVDSTVVLVKASSSIANVRVTGYRIALGDSESADTGDNVNIVAATTVNSGATALDTFASDVYTGAFYVVVGYNSTEGAASISEVSVVTNGGVSYVSTGPVLSTKETDQLSFTTGVSGTTVTLNAASTSGSSTTVNAYRVHMLRGIGGAVADTVTVSENETISGTKTFTAPLTLTVGSDPSTVANNAHIYAKDESSSAEVFVKDEAGNVTKISPHNEQGEWEYYSRNTKTGKTVRVNMEEMIRDIEKLTGKSYIKND